MQYGWGWNRANILVNGDLIQRYRNGVPAEVDVQNTPVRQFTNLDADMGVFVQDSWTIDRLTLSGGLRWEYFKGSVGEQFAEAGRPVPDRHFGEIPDLPNWKDLTPRVGVSYDVFGDSKTALKGSVSRSDNLLVDQTDYTPVTITSSLDGHLLTVYNLVNRTIVPGLIQTRHRD